MTAKTQRHEGEKSLFLSVSVVKISSGTQTASNLRESRVSNNK
jgi:hypothetical protein